MLAPKNAIEKKIDTVEIFSKDIPEVFASAKYKEGPNPLSWRPTCREQMIEIAQDTFMRCYADTNGYMKYLNEKEPVLEAIEQAYLSACEDVEEETKQAMEALIHNFNSLHSRAGGQVPFSSINYGLDTSPEGRLIIDKVLDAIWNGLGHGETAIFPISVFQLKAGVNYNPGDPNYDLFKKSCKVSAKRLYPNYVNIDAPFNLQYYKPGDYNSTVSTMG